MSKLEVWKYPLMLTEYQKIEMPRGTQPLYVAMQNEILCLWCQVFPEAQRIRREVFIFRTGQPNNARAEFYAGSAMMFGGQFIWHVFLGDEL